MFSKKTICFVTGASRGLGESIAQNFACKFPTGSLIVLLARSGNDLEKVKKLLLEQSPHLKVVVRVFDQSTQDELYFEAVFSQTLRSANVVIQDFKQAILVNNAGSIKPMLYVRNLTQVTEITNYFNTNVTGVMALTSHFLRTFPDSSQTDRVIINISSLAATQPFKSWALYCSGKAARDMFFKVIAVEETDVRVLNYAPGPLLTTMSDTIVDCEDIDVRNWAKNAKAEKSLLSCDTSVAKLMQILEKNVFENGAHIDYYDDI